MLGVFVFLFVRSHDLAVQVESMAIEIRQSQIEGCNRTNERNKDINSEFESIYVVARNLIEDLGGDSRVILRYQKEFGGLKLVDCAAAYPSVQPEGE